MNVIRFLAVSFVLFSVLCPLVRAEIITGQVVGIADGDTLTLLDATNQQHKIRLAGIDAPEKKQDFGQKAKASLSALVYARSAKADCKKRDRYRRQICVVTISGKDVGLEQVQSGLAWWYRHYARDQSRQDRDDYEQAERRAKNSRLGLWSSMNPMPPWDWRHNKVAQ